MNILLTGSIAYDYLMTFPGYFLDHILPEKLDSISLSFLVDSMVRRPGGIAPNIAHTMALLGAHPRLWATVGEDFEPYRQELEKKGIDTSGVRVIPGVFTASFFVNTDKANSQIASFYPGAMAYAAQLSLHELDVLPDLVVISPNEPAAMRQYCEECLALGIPYIYDPSQQIVRLSADDLRSGLLGARALFVNDYEYALIAKNGGLSAESLLQTSQDAYVVITKGENGAEIQTPSKVYAIPSIKPDVIRDPTGVGDAFRGGFFTGLHYDLPLELCGQLGSLAATYCLEQSGAQGQTYTPAEFVTRFRTRFDDRGLLNCIIES